MKGGKEKETQEEEEEGRKVVVEAERTEDGVTTKAKWKQLKNRFLWHLRRLLSLSSIREKLLACLRCPRYVESGAQFSLRVSLSTSLHSEFYLLVFFKGGRRDGEGGWVGAIFLPIKFLKYLFS